MHDVQNDRRNDSGRSTVSSPPLRGIAAATRACLAVALLLNFTPRVDAQVITLTWDSNRESDLAGYVIAYGTGPGRTERIIDVGLATKWTLGDLAHGRTYYFRVHAYDHTGLKSLASREVSATIGASGSTGGCPTVAPGDGWTCVNGGWLPPKTIQQPGTPSQPALTSGCPGTAPVAEWVCLDGNWLPPDSPLLETGSKLPSSGTQSPPVLACAGSAPAAGWVCQTGNWLPPDSPLIQGAQPASAAAGCATIRPAAGWICHAGNWLPPGSPLLPTSVTKPILSTCPGTAPATGWACQDGNWLPPDSPLLRRSVRTRIRRTTAPPCPGLPPGQGWVCITGNWVPPDHPLATSSGGR